MMLPPEPDRWTIDLANAQRMEAIVGAMSTSSSGCCTSDGARTRRAIASSH